MADDRSLLLSFIASLTLADHMGDVADNIDCVLKRLGVEIRWDDWDELGDELAKMGVTTLYGHSLREDDEMEA